MSNKVWKIVKILTLAIPLPIFLFLNATLFSIEADYTIYATIDTVTVVEYQEAYFIYPNDTNANMDGFIAFNGERYGIPFTSDDIIKIGKGYYSYIEVDDVMGLTDIRKFEIQKEQSYKIPLTFFISLGGVLIILAIIQNKMKWHKDHPKGAVLLALITGTVVLLVIELIVSSILGVFIVATVSWGAYLLEDMVEKNMISKDKAEQTESALMKAMKEALK